MTHRHIRPHIILALLAIILFAYPAHAMDKQQLPRLSLTGTGMIKSAPNMAIISSGVITQAISAKKALANNSQKMKSIFTTLENSGFDKKDIQTSKFNVGPRYKYSKDGTPPRIIGYQVTNQVTIRVKNLRKLGALIDQMAQLGANRIGSIRFTHSNMTELQDKARAEAVKDALRKAEIYTQGTNTKRVRILSISENIHTPRPISMAMESSAKMARSDVPIAAGESSIRAQVNIVWEIE